LVHSCSKAYSACAVLGTVLLILSCSTFFTLVASPHPSSGFYENVFLNRRPADVPIRIQNRPLQNTSYKINGFLMNEIATAILLSVSPGTCSVSDEFYYKSQNIFNIHSSPHISVVSVHPKHDFISLQSYLTVFLFLQNLLIQCLSQFRRLRIVYTDVLQL